MELNKSQYGTYKHPITHTQIGHAYSSHATL